MWDTVSSLYNHIPNIINLSKKAKSYCLDTKTLKKYQLFYLKVKGQSEVTKEHDTPSHDYSPTYQISLIYRKRQKSYDSDTITLQKYQLFDLEVKGQRQNVVMLVHDTPSHDYTPTYQIHDHWPIWRDKKVMARQIVNLQIHSDWTKS